MALSTGNIGKYEFLKGGDVLPDKRLLEKAAIKRFECSRLGSELKKQTDNLGRQYQGLDKVYEFDKKGGKWYYTLTVKIYNKSNLLYNSNHSFWKYQNFKNLITFLFSQSINF